MTHSIHVVPPLRVFVLLKYQFLSLFINLSRLILRDVDFGIPISVNFKEHFLLLRCLATLLHISVDITLYLEHVSGGPSSLSVRQMAFKVRILYQLDGRSAADINVRRADD